MQIVAILICSLLAFTLLVAVTNYVTDPAGIYRPSKSKQARNLRLRKLSLLRALRRAPYATLVLGSSRVFNLSLAADARFPQPTLNFAVTTAKAEDYLACYRLARAAQTQPPSLVIIGIEHPAFHPTMRPQWEAYTAGIYTDELEAIGALRRGLGWRQRMLLSPTQFHQSLIEIQRLGRSRGGLAALLVTGRWRSQGSARQKFRWSADGSGTWMDVLEGKRNPKLLARQLRNFPRSGLGISSYTRIGQQRLRWFELLLEQCAADGTQVIAYIVPAHPLLVEKTWRLGFQPMHEQLVNALRVASSQHGAVFHDWYDGSALGLDDSHFRDVMHLTDEGQAIIARRLAESN
ncbi:MAG: hypothetical protein M3R04_09375 [bacterium]|nr:hypothetical protein [bacterium]